MSEIICSVSIGLTRFDLSKVAQIVIDRIEDDYGYEVAHAAGVEDGELLEGLINNDVFRSIVLGKVAEDGRVVCEDPYGYFDAFDFIDNIGALYDIYNHVDAIDDIFKDADKEEIACIPVPAGYKLVKV